MTSQEAVYHDGKCIGFVGHRSYFREVTYYDEDGEFLGWTADRNMAHALLMERYAKTQVEDGDDD